MKVGIAKVDLTPSIPVTIDGFGSRDKLSGGIEHQIEGVCAVFESGGTRLCIMGLDLLAVDDYMMVPLRRAARDLGIPAKHVMINTSHGHAVPNTTPCRSFMRSYEEGYLEEARDKLCGLMHDAVGDLQEARLDYTVGSCTLGMNRRSMEGLNRPNPTKPIDMDVPVLRVLAPDGRTRALLFSYACHPVTVNGYDISPDFPGYAREMIAEKIPGCQPLFLQGCGADINPRSLDPVQRRYAFGSVPESVELGHELGRAVLAALSGTPMPLGEQLAADGEYVQIPFGPQPTEEDVIAVEATGGFYATWAEAVRRVWDSGHKLPYQLPIEVLAFNIGGLYVIGMAAEVCAEVGLRIKQTLRDRTVCALGYCNGAWDYFAPREAHREAGYEHGYEVFTSFMDTVWPWVQPRGFSPDSEDILIESIIELLSGLDSMDGH